MDEVVDGYELFEANDIQASDDDAIKRILGMFTERLLTDVQLFSPIWLATLPLTNL